VEGNFEIYVMSAHGGKPKRMTDDPASDFAPRWSRDGDWIYFGSNRTGERQIWRIAAEGGKPVQLTQRGGIAAFESTNRRFVYFTKGPNDIETSLWRIPVEGGEEVQVLESVWMRGFAVASEGIYYVVPPDPSGRSAIQFLTFASNKPQRILEFENPGGGLALSPDGRTLLYAKFDQASDDLVLVENFR
jgi:Tol biopolymer transport system component